MAEPLKNHFGENIPYVISEMISSVYPSFPQNSFITESLEDYAYLELMQRAWKIAHALRKYLPGDYSQAINILIASLGPKLETTENFGMAPFLYLPHVFFVAEYGLNYFEVSMQAQYELTQRFTAEFSLRPYLEKFPQETLAQLKIWVKDESPHVRRLVSEGSRPRLPWASRLCQFQKNPKPILKILELLKDDPSLYVRRSVANHLNDIGKDHPELLIKVTKQWLHEASEQRCWLVHHALRSAIKRGDLQALAVLGFNKPVRITIHQSNITPSIVSIGESINVQFSIKNTDCKIQKLLVDFRIHFIKSNGKSSQKVFKLKKIKLEGGEILELNKRVSLAEMTTRKHYPVIHLIDVLINGQVVHLGKFELVK